MSERYTCFLIARDQLIHLRKMVDHLKRLPLDVIIVDCASTNPTLLSYYKTNPCRVIRCRSNLGERAGWACGAVDAFATEYFLYSDSDLDLSDVPDDFPEVLKAGLIANPRANCAGLSLSITDLPIDNPGAQNSIQYERSYWQTKASDGFWNAPTDTTMAMYCRSRPTNGKASAIRSDSPYTARHLPWYYSVNNPPKSDYMYYLQSAEKVVSSNAASLLNMTYVYDLSVLIPTLKDRAPILKQMLSSIYAYIEDNCSYTVEVLVESDEGQLSSGAKRQLLLTRARGKYCVFIDDDDVIHPDYFAVYNDMIRDGNYTHSELYAAYYFEGVFRKRVWNSNENSEWLETEQYYLRQPSHLSVMLTEHALSVGYSDMRDAEDRDFCYRMRDSRLLSNEFKLQTKKPMYHYHDGIKSRRHLLKPKWEGDYVNMVPI